MVWFELCKLSAVELIENKFLTTMMKSGMAHKLSLGMIILLSILHYLQAQAQTLTDPRDGKVYKTVTIGDMTWFAENLNYKIQGSYCYDNQDQNCDKYGRLYKWEIALSACPPGWHLSTEYEWQYLETALGMEFRELAYRSNRGVDEGGKMKEGAESGMEILYGGWRRKNGTYRALGENSAFWDATEADLDHAWHRDIDTGDDFVYRSRVVKSYALSCRCVKNWAVQDETED